jgi:acyl-CoA synthetase (AMP-forming)/AMP-acid ligase II
MRGVLVPENPGWRSTGDLAKWTPEELQFAARADDRFRFANGRMVAPSTIEEQLRTLTQSKDIFWVFTRDCVVLYGADDTFSRRGAHRTSLWRHGRIVQSDQATAADFFVSTSKGGATVVQ